MADNVCGAKTRSGKRCKNKGMTNGRCRLHGGASTGAPKGNKNAQKHGIYSRIFSSDELDAAIAMQGDVSRELAIARLQLARLLEIKKVVSDTPELDERRDETLADGDDEESVKTARAKDAAMCGEYYDPSNDDFGVSGQESDPLKRMRIYRRRDWSVEENRLITLIARLEMQLVKQQLSTIELEQRKKDIEAQARKESGETANVENMSDDELDKYLERLLKP